jgi:3-methyladenine DNA glycosylase AlkD
MKIQEIIKELKSLGTPAIKNIHANHGAEGECYGVKVGDLKNISKKIKGNQEIAMELYDTKIYDAMYLAGIVADGSKMSKKEINDWAEKATSPMISDYTVPWVASESMYAQELADKWIESKTEKIIASGWFTQGAIVTITPDENLDIKKIKSLVDRVVKTIHKAPNRVRSSMNLYVISVGGYVAELTKYAQDAAKKMGDVEIYMGNTACKVPSAFDYIEKMKKRGNIGKKKKTVKC